MSYNSVVNTITGATAEIEVEISKSGLSCLWEAGGGWTSTGSSQVICDHFGNPKKAIYVPTRGDLCNGRHALIPVKIGDMLIEDNERHGNHEIFVWEITGIEDGKAILSLVEYSTKRKLDEEPSYSDAVMAAMNKASDYHCRDVYYAHL